MQTIAFYIKTKGGVPLPSGGKLTVRRLLTMGIMFGTHGGIDKVHEMIVRMKSDLQQFDFFTRPTLSAFDAMLSLDDTVIYALLHEAIYCEGQASNWAADRVGKTFKEFPWLNGQPASPSLSIRAQPLYFSGEMIFPFMFEAYPELEKLKEVAELLAQFKDWPSLYDEKQLSRNEVPVSAALNLINQGGDPP